MNPYEILELQPGASIVEIRAAYDRLAKQWHPDKFPEEKRGEGMQRFRQLADAFKMLKDGGAAVKEGPAPAEPAKPPAPSIALNTSPTAYLGEPQGGQDWFARAKSAFTNGKNEQAQHDIEEAIRLDAETYEYHALHAKILDAIGGDKRALVQSLEHCLRLDKKDADSAIRTAEIYQEMGMYTRATRYWEWARNLAPNHDYFKRQEAEASAATGVKGKALEAVEGISGSVRGMFEEAKGLFGKFGKKG